MALDFAKSFYGLGKAAWERTLALVSVEPGSKFCPHHLTALKCCHLVLQTWLPTLVTPECWGWGPCDHGSREGEHSVGTGSANGHRPRGCWCCSRAGPIVSCSEWKKNVV